MKPAASHCARSCPSVKYWLMFGTATLTIVEAMTDAIVPSMTVPSDSQR